MWKGKMKNKKDLLAAYQPGIASINSELADKVIRRACQRCENPLCKHGDNLQIHHMVGRRRKAWLGNLLYLCDDCHDNGAHGVSNPEAGKFVEGKLTQLKQYYKKYFTPEEVRYLMNYR